jgi:hypothetical protein
MSSKSIALWAVCGVLLAGGQLRAEDVERSPWNFAPVSTVSDAPTRNLPTPPMFGDQFQFGFNLQGGFQGGFNFGGGFQGGFNLQGGFNQGGFNLQGGFNQGGLQTGLQTGFQGGFNLQGGLNLGGFQGGFNLQTGSGFNIGFGAPVAVARGAFKIAENESPRPQDRFFATYNYYDQVLNASLQVHREMVGVEKTFLGGNASVELRLPFIQSHASGAGTESEIADMTAIVKYAFINEPDRVLSAGLAVTAPTSGIPTVLILRPTGFEAIHPTLLQPFVGYIWGVNDFFIQGFSSVMAPTDSRDGTWMFNDVGIGYWLWRGEGRLKAIVPTFETHVNTPFNHRGAPGFGDSVDLTAGSYFYLGQRLTVGMALGTPVTGPKLFDFEALVNLNWRF